MAIEHELRFVVSWDWFQHVRPQIDGTAVDIIQGYLVLTDNTTVRIRAATRVDSPDTTSYWYTTKTTISPDGAKRHEWEIELTQHQVAALFDFDQCDHDNLFSKFTAAIEQYPVVRKTRFQYTDALGTKWEVDYFPEVKVRYNDMGYVPLVLAEVELNQSGTLPAFVPPFFKRNVTGILSNAGLATVHNPSTEFQRIVYLDLIQYNHHSTTPFLRG